MLFGRLSPFRKGVTVVENCHAFAAIRGVQAGREYFVTMLPLRVVPKLFPFEDTDLPAELRAQDR